MKYSIIIPAYDEEETIQDVIREVKNIFNDKEFEIIVVDDGSADATAVKARSAGVKIIRHRKNVGKGAAIRTGFKEAEGKIICIQDADMTYLPEDLPRLIQVILENKADVVYGSRFMGKIEEGAMNLSHNIGNRILSLITSILFKKNLTDIMTGYKVLKKGVYKNLQLTANSFDIEAEITGEILKRKYKLIELPIKYKSRNFGRAKIGCVHGFTSLLRLIMVRFRRSSTETVLKYDGDKCC